MGQLRRWFVVVMVFAALGSAASAVRAGENQQGAPKKNFVQIVTEASEAVKGSDQGLANRLSHFAFAVKEGKKEEDPAGNIEMIRDTIGLLRGSHPDIAQSLSEFVERKEKRMAMAKAAQPA